MELIERIKNKVGNAHVDGFSKVLEVQIVKHIQHNEIDEAFEGKLLKALEAGRTSEEKLLAVCDQALKVHNRVLVSFNSLAELSEFEKNNEIGKFWFDEENKKYKAYKY